MKVSVSFEAEAIDALYHPVPHSAVLLHGPVVCLSGWPRRVRLMRGMGNDEAENTCSSVCPSAPVCLSVLFKLQTVLFVLPPPPLLTVSIILYVCGCVAVERGSAGLDMAQRFLKSVYYCGSTELDSVPLVCVSRTELARLLSFFSLIFSSLRFFCHLYFIHPSV